MSAKGRRANLSPEEKRARLARLLRQKADRAERSYPLAHGPRALWFLHQLAPQSSANNEAFAWRSTVKLSVADLRSLAQMLIDRHPVLRTTYSHRNGEPSAIVHPYQEPSFEVTDASDWSNEQLQDALAREANRPFDLERGPVFRLHVFDRTADQIVLTTVHHIAIDLWSMALIMEELQAMHLAQRLGVPVVLPPLEHTYEEFVRWQANMLDGPEGNRQKNYWHRQLAGELPVLDLPTDRPRPPVQTYRGATQVFTLDERLTAKLKDLAQNNQTTLYACLLAAFQVLLHRYSGQEDLLVGSVMAGRTQPDFERIVGYMANPVALRADLGGDPTFQTFLASVRQTVLEAMAHQDYPFSLLVEQLLQHRDPSRPPMVNVVFILQKPQGFESERKRQRGISVFGAADAAQKGVQVALGDRQIEIFLLEHHIAKFDLELEMFETGSEITGWMRYNTDLFEAATVARMVANFQVLLDGIVQNPRQRLSELPLLSAEERRQVLTASLPRESSCQAAAPAREISSPNQHLLGEECVHLGIERRAMSPDGETLEIAAGNGRYSCAVLNALANRAAQRLLQHGIGRGDRVGILAGPSVERIAALLGILKTGAAFVPLEPSDPDARRAVILKAAEPALVLTQATLRGQLASFQGAVRLIEEDLADKNIGSAQNPAIAVSPDDLAYVHFSSGPGIVVTHRQIAKRLMWLQREFLLTEADVVLHHAPLTLDVSVWEIFWPLLFGGRLVVAATDGPAQILRVLSEHQVSRAHWVPSDLGALLDYCREKGEALPRSLRWVCCSGEPLRQSLVERFFQCVAEGNDESLSPNGHRHLAADRCSKESPDALGASPSRLSYFYAAPEAGREVAVYHCRPRMDHEFVPLGRPATAMYVLDRHLHPLPFGVRGEICIPDDGRNPVYWNASQETAEHLCSNPLVQPPAGERLIRTGDVGCLRSDGHFELSLKGGRQGWIRGFRVCLDAVEAALLRDPAVRDCAVFLPETETSGPCLIAYVVPSAGQLVPERLRARLEAVLPTARIPIAFVPLAGLPLTLQGRLDERALGRQEVIDDELIRRWEETLNGLPEIGRAVVVVEEASRDADLLHLAELLPASKRAVAPPVAEENRLPHKSVSNKKDTPAFSQAEPLQLPADFPATLGEALRRAAAEAPDVAVVHLQARGGTRLQSQAALLEEARCLGNGLRQLGLMPGDKVIFQLDQSHDFVPSLWACVLNGFVPVPMSVPPTYRQPNNALARLQQAWRQLGKPLVLTNRPLANDVRSLEDSLPLPELRIATVEDLRGAEPATEVHESRPHDPALLLLTSGSTGIPKGVLLSHANLLSMCAGTIQHNGFSHQDVSLNSMGMDHVGAIVPHMVMPVLLRCPQIHAPTRAILENPLCWLDWIERYRVSITWIPNFGYALINRHADQLARGHWDLSSLRFLINAGESIVARTARQFLKLLEPHGLPPTAMHPAFGMSETSSGLTWSANFSLDMTSDDMPFVELGPPIPGASLRIVDDQGQVVAEGEVGNLQVKGPSVFSGYYENPELTQAVFRDGGWFDTGDRGFLHEGRLTLTGRRKDVIIINGVNYPNHEIEAVVEEVEGVAVSYTAACAVHSPDGVTDEVAIFFSPSGDHEEIPAELLKRIRAHVVRRVGVNPAYLIPLERQAIPKTEIGKIQRTVLAQRLAAGEFDELLRKIDRKTGRDRTLPNWFFRKTFRAKQLCPATSHVRPRRCLIFLDQSGLGTLVAEKLRSEGGRCVVVSYGTDFARLGPDQFRIRPEEAGHYDLLLQAIARERALPEQVLHLGAYGSPAGEITSLKTLEDALDRDVRGMLHLIQALAKVADLSGGIRLTAVSSHVQAVAPNEKLAWEKTPLLGLLPAASQELPGLDSCHIDLPPDDLEANAGRLLLEVRVPHKDGEVVYRDGERRVPRLEKTAWEQVRPRGTPFRNGGLYLLSGGLGGVGRQLARHLLREHQARLLILGRTALPPFDGPEAAEDERQRERVEVLRELQAIGEVRYEAVDVADEAGVRQAVQQAISHWQRPLDGMIHLAGVRHDRALVEESAASFFEALRAKALGAWVLHQFVRERPGCLFLAFSSVNSFFGGARAGLYAAANRMVEGLVHHQRRLGCERSYCYAWSMLDEVGMSRDYPLKRLTRSQGFHLLTGDQWLNSLLVALHHGQTHLLIGLDENNVSMRGHMETSWYRAQRLTAYFTTASDNDPAARLRSLEVRDRFQRRSRCAFVQVPELPLTEAGAVDRTRLAALTGRAKKPDGDRVSPRNEIESQVARVFQEVLDVPQLGVHDDFFELGGHSLLAIQLTTRLSTAFGVELPLQALVGDPTVAGIAQVIERQRAGVSSGDSAPDLKAEAILDPSIRPCNTAVTPAVEPATIFLTGATGFLGGHLLHELLRRTRAEVYCLVRAANAAEGLRRIEANLDAYALDFQFDRARLHAVPGDLAKPLLGLKPSEFQEMAEKVEVVYHSGAQVNFIYPYETLKGPNVLGTQEAIRLACQGRVKPLHFVSTLTVFPLIDLNHAEVAWEADPLDHSELLLSGYAQSKWVAEKLVMAARDRGLPVAIYRPGRITGHSRTGVGEADDLMWTLIRQCIQLGQVPAVDVNMDMTPVDFVSGAIVRLAQRPESLGKAFHLVNPRSLAWRELVAWIRDFGYPLREIPLDEWQTRALQQQGQSVGKELLALLPAFSSFQSEGRVALPQLRYDCRNTLDGLAGTGIVCPPVDNELLSAYFAHLIQRQFLTPPPGKGQRGELKP